MNSQQLKQISEIFGGLANETLRADHKAIYADIAFGFAKAAKEMKELEQEPEE